MVQLARRSAHEARDRVPPTSSGYFAEVMKEALDLGGDDRTGFDAEPLPAPEEVGLRLKDLKNADGLSRQAAPARASGTRR